MSALLFAAAVVTASPTPVPNTVGPTTAHQQTQAAVCEEVRTGSLIFSQGDCLAIRVFTASRYTHVAAVVRESGKPVVYDSTSGVGVRKQSLERYLDAQRPDVIHVVHPAEAFSGEQARAFHEHLENQLGRPYAIRHHLTGQRSTGLHCAEYVTDALISVDLIHANKPPRVSPASLAEGILDAELYADPVTFSLSAVEAAQYENAGWCSRMWSQTKLCTVSSCVKLRRWFLCR
jgi:hypothetical protein